MTLVTNPDTPSFDIAFDISMPPKQKKKHLFWEDFSKIIAIYAELQNYFVNHVYGAIKYAKPHKDNKLGWL
jgi:hypothetical protein